MWIEKPVENSLFNETYWDLPGCGVVYKTYHPTKPYEAYNADRTKSARFKTLDSAKRAVENNEF